MAVTADEDEQGKLRMQSAVIKQSAANFAPPPPKIVKRMVCGVILAAELGPSGWVHADTSNGSLAGGSAAFAQLDWHLVTRSGSRTNGNTGNGRDDCTIGLRAQGT